MKDSYRILSVLFVALISGAIISAIMHACDSGYYIDPRSVRTVTPTPGVDSEYTPYTVSWSESFDWSQGTFEGVAITENGSGIQLELGDPADFRPTHICVGVADSHRVCFHELEDPTQKVCYTLDSDARPSRTAIDKNGYCFVGGDIGAGGNGKLYKVHKEYGVVGVGQVPGSGAKAHSIAIDAQNFVWVGNSGNMNMYKFNPNPVEGVLNVAGGPYEVATSAINDPRPYGAAIDSQGFLYVVGKQNYDMTNGFISKIDTSDGSLVASGVTPIYGIAIDDDDYPWVADYNGGHLIKIDKTQTGQTLNILLNIDVPADSDISNINGRGVGKDTDGNIWMADSAHSYVFKYSPDGDYLGKVSTSNPRNTGCGPVGVSGDLYGNVWAVNRSCSSLAKIERDILPTGDNLEKVTVAPTENGPYSYSDMVGFGLFSTVLRPHGSWIINFDSGFTDPVWEYIRWRAKANEQSQVYLEEVRVAASEAELETASAYGPYFDSPASITSLPGLRWIQLKVTFETQNQEGITPVLEDLSIGFSLPDV